MKRSLIATLLVLAILLATGSAGLFAEGQQETLDGRINGYRFTEDYAEPELVTVTGTLTLTDRDFPILTSEDAVYDLMVPRYHLYSLDLPEGLTITVEGYLMNSQTSRGIDEGEEHLQVTKATIDGKEYELDFDRGPMRRWDDDRGRFDSRRLPHRGRMPMRGRS